MPAIHLRCGNVKVKIGTRILPVKIITRRLVNYENSLHGMCCIGEGEEELHHHVWPGPQQLINISHNIILSMLILHLSQQIPTGNQFH